MALNFSTDSDYTGRIEPASASYPYGEPRDQQGGASGTGFPVITKHIRDLYGFLQGLLDESGVTPSGSAETAENSQYRNALKALTTHRPGRLKIYAAAAATGDGTGIDEDNKISYLNLFKKGGLLTRDYECEVYLTENTIDIGEDAFIAGDTSLLSSGALTFEDFLTVNSAGFAVFRKASSESESWPVTLNSGLRAINNATVQSLSSVTVNGVVPGTSNTSILQGANTVFSCEQITSENDLDIGISATCRSSQDITVSGSITVNDRSSITCILGDVITSGGGGLTVSGHSSVITGGGGAITVSGDLLVDYSSFVRSTTRSVTGTQTIVTARNSYAVP